MWSALDSGVANGSRARGALTLRERARAKTKEAPYRIRELLRQRRSAAENRGRLEPLFDQGIRDRSSILRKGELAHPQVSIDRPRRTRTRSGTHARIIEVRHTPGQPPSRKEGRHGSALRAFGDADISTALPMNELSSHGTGQGGNRKGETGVEPDAKYVVATRIPAANVPLNVAR